MRPLQPLSTAQYSVQFAKQTNSAG